MRPARDNCAAGAAQPSKPFEAKAPAKQCARQAPRPPHASRRTGRHFSASTTTAVGKPWHKRHPCCRPLKISVASVRKFILYMFRLHARRGRAMLFRQTESCCRLFQVAAAFMREDSARKERRQPVRESEKSSSRRCSAYRFAYSKIRENPRIRGKKQAFCRGFRGSSRIEESAAVSAGFASAPSALGRFVDRGRAPPPCQWLKPARDGEVP